MKNKRLRRLVDYVSHRNCSFKDAVTCEIFIMSCIDILKEKTGKFAKECQCLQEAIDAGSTNEVELAAENEKLQKEIDTLRASIRFCELSCGRNQR